MNEDNSDKILKINILIIDDQKLYIEYLKNLILKYIDNVNIFTSNSGKEALSILENNHIDIVLSDIIMPDIDGWDIARYIKNDLNDKNIALIFITANCKGDEFIKQGFKLGAVDYIEKPIDKNQLINRLTLYIKNFLSEKKINEEISKNKIKDKLILQKEIMLAQSNILERIAHHWRQPLTVISSNAGVIKLNIEFGLDTHENILKNISNIENASQNLSQTIDQFKTFFQPETIKEIFNMNEIIVEILDVMSFTLNEENINIEFENINIKLEGYKNEFKQILISLLTNSIEALEKKDYDKFIKIIINEFDDYIELLIIDNGGGIDEEISDHIYQPYFTTKHSYSGTGLSLHLVKEVIQRYFNGDIQNSNLSYKFKDKEYDSTMFRIVFNKI